MRHTSIVVLTYNHYAYNKGLYESIRTYSPYKTYEIIFVDNNSTDETKEWLQTIDHLPDVKVIYNEENAGFPAGCNQGIKIAEADYDILLLNNDIEVTHNWLENLRTALYSDDYIGAVQGLDAHHFHGTANEAGEEIDFNRIALPAAHHFAKKNNISDDKRWRYSNFLTGYCMLIKRPVVDQIGLLDERFSPGNFEDDDYSYRILRAGYALLQCHDCFIHHYGSQSFRKSELAYRQLLSQNAAKFQRKWGFDAWDKRHADYDLLHLLEAGAGEFHILQLGCKAGGTYFHLKNTHPAVTYVAIEKDDACRALVEPHFTVHATLDKVKNERFDFILVKDASHYTDELPTFLAQLKSMLKPNGTLIANFDNPYFVSRVKERMRVYKPEHTLDIMLRSDKEIEELFKGAGFGHCLVFNWFHQFDQQEQILAAVCQQLMPHIAQHLYRTAYFTVKAQV